MLQIPARARSFFSQARVPAACKRRSQVRRRPALEPLESRIVLTAYTFTGQAGGSWSDENSWSPQGVPGLADSASIPAHATVVVDSVAIVTALTLDGTLDVKSELKMGSANGENPTLTGGGTVVLEGQYSDITAGVVMYNNDVLTIGHGITVIANGGAIGGGLYGGAILDQGAINANGSAGDLNLLNVSIDAGGSLSLTGGVNIIVGSYLSGGGSILANAGLITIGEGSRITVGDYTQTATGALDIHIDTAPLPTQSPRIDATNESLAGSLTATYVNGFQPSPGQVYWLIGLVGFESPNGTFDTVDGGDAIYSDTGVYLKIPAQQQPVIKLASAPNPSTYGQPVTFTATVSPASSGLPTPTGTVTFEDGSTSIGSGTLNASGVATFTTSTLAVGMHSITAAYGGDGNFSSSTSSPVTQMVSAPQVIPTGSFTAYRPITSDINYLDYPIPKAEQDSAGVGIRIDGEDNSHSSTQTGQPDPDLIAVSLDVSSPDPTGFHYVIQATNPDIEVWKDQSKTTSLLKSGSATLSLSSAQDVLWVEWFGTSQGADSLSLLAVSNATDQATTLATLNFHTFASDVIIFTGDTLSRNHGGSFPATLGPMLTVAKSLYASGYDVHIFVPKESPSVLSRVIGPGAAYDEIRSAVSDRDVSQIAMIGYSHGGGAVYNLARYIKQTRLLQSKPNVIIPFSCYVDAINYRTIANLTGEDKIPPQTHHLLNIYQSNQHYFYSKHFHVEHHGVYIHSPVNGLVDNEDVTLYGYMHGSIATSPLVQNMVETQLKLFATK